MATFGPLKTLGSSHLHSGRYFRLAKARHQLKEVIFQ